MKDVSKLKQNVYSKEYNVEVVLASKAFRLMKWNGIWKHALEVERQMLFEHYMCLFSPLQRIRMYVIIWTILGIDLIDFVIYLYRVEMWVKIK